MTLVKFESNHDNPKYFSSSQSERASYSNIRRQVVPSYYRPLDGAQAHSCITLQLLYCFTLLLTSSTNQSLFRFKV